MDQLIGRKRETESLLRSYHSTQSEFVVIYGRRRIGKTFLVNRLFSDLYAFQYTGGHHLKSEQQLAKFSEALKTYGHSAFEPKLKNWFDAFRHLEWLLDALPKSERKLVFIDEMPWIDTQHSDFVSALEDFWNSWATLRDDICFIACGSASSWMVDKLVDNQGGLHNRITNRVYLPPFTLAECEAYLQSRGFVWDRYQLTQCYMTLGGVPFYLKLLDPKMSWAQNIDTLFFRKDGVLSNEFGELYHALFKNVDKYITVIKALAEKREGLTRQEIIDATGLSGGGLTTVLSNLERCDFIFGYSKFNSTSKNTIYRLIDFFTLFHLRFEEGQNSQDKNYWSNRQSNPQVIAWQGLTFELVCLVHLEQIKRSLGIAGVATNSCSWRSDTDGRRAQIDLLIDRDDRIINLCEMKFSQGPYVIDKSYEMAIRERISRFKAETKTRKGVAVTFVTTFGLMPNAHASIVQNQVTMDDLFNP